MIDMEEIESGCYGERIDENKRSKGEDIVNDSDKLKMNQWKRINEPSVNDNKLIIIENYILHRKIPKELILYLIYFLI